MTTTTGWLARTRARLIDAARRSAKSAASTVTALAGAGAVLLTTGAFDSAAALALLAGLGAAIIVDLGVAIRDSLVDFADAGASTSDADSGAPESTTDST